MLGFTRGMLALMACVDLPRNSSDMRKQVVPSPVRLPKTKTTYSQSAPKLHFVSKNIYAVAKFALYRRRVTHIKWDHLLVTAYFNLTRTNLSSRLLIDPV